jgi:hypothetical protein
VIWESGECQKVELTALELGWTIIEKVDDIPESSDYILIGLMFSILLCLTPVLGLKILIYTTDKPDMLTTFNGKKKLLFNLLTFYVQYRERPSMIKQ